TMTTKATGTTANYPLSAAVTHSSYFAKASFTATASGPTLTGGIGGTPPPPPPPPTPIGTLLQQTSNNTSACSSSADPSANLSYCFSAFDGFNANPNDLSAESL